MHNKDVTISHILQGNRQLRIPHRYHTRKSLLHVHILRARHALRIHRRRRLFRCVSYNRG
jgi:hypothetical protein